MDKIRQTRAEENINRKKKMADITISAYGDGFGYAAAVEMLKDMASTLTHLPFDDPAYAYFSRKVGEFERLAAALCVKYCPNSKDHLTEHKVIWSYNKDKVLEETSLWVPLNTKPRNLHNALKIAGSARLYEEGLSFDEVNSLEVELL